jgi:hypothetical protein
MYPARHFTVLAALHFGLLTIDWAAPGVPVGVQILDASSGAVLLAKDLSLAMLGAR